MFVNFTKSNNAVILHSASRSRFIGRIFCNNSALQSWKLSCLYQLTLLSRLSVTIEHWDEKRNRCLTILNIFSDRMQRMELKWLWTLGAILLKQIDWWSTHKRWELIVQGANEMKNFEDYFNFVRSTTRYAC